MHTTPSNPGKNEYIEKHKIQLKLLSQQSTTTPEDFAKFASGFTQNFPGGNASLQHSYEAKALLKSVAAKYICSFATQLSKVKNSPSTTLALLNATLIDFIKNFPGGEKSIIHCQDTPEYGAFAKLVVEALCIKAGLDSDRFTLDRGQCVEANTLQLIGKLCIPLKTSYKPRFGNAVSLKEITQNLIEKGTAFFIRKLDPRLANHLSYTLTGLTHIDINQFRTRERDSGFIPTFTEYNRPIDGIVNASLKAILSNPTSWSADALIRIMHSVILLSRSEDKFLTYLKASEADVLLQVIENQLKTNPLSNRSLAQQLFQIRNIYPEVFPENLSQTIEPFIEQFSESAHGSDFEVEIHRTLVSTAEMLAQNYPIDPTRFDPHNPICESLGLESDITYQTPAVKACIQVDGDRYHKYVGTQTTTQRTLLRDHCFKNDGWQLITFTNNQKDAKVAETFLIEKIIIPSYEANTREDIHVIHAFITNKESYENAQRKLGDSLPLARKKTQIFGEKLMAIKQHLQKLSSRGISVTEYQKEYDFANDFYQYSVESQKYANSYQTLLDDALKQASNFDFPQAEKMAHISSVLLDVNNAIAFLELKSSELINADEKIQEEIQKLEKIIFSKTLTEEETNSSLDVIRTKIHQKFLDLQLLKSHEDALNEAISANKKSEYKGPSRIEIKQEREKIETAKGMLETEYSIVEKTLKSIHSEIKQLESTIRHLQNKRPKAEEIIQIKMKLDEAIESKLKLENALKAPTIGESLCDDINKLDQAIGAVSHETMSALQENLDAATQLEASLSLMLSAPPVPRAFTPGYQAMTSGLPYHTHTPSMYPTPTTMLYPTPPMPYSPHGMPSYLPSYAYYGGCYYPYPVSSSHQNTYPSYPYTGTPSSSMSTHTDDSTITHSDIRNHFT